MWSSEKVNFGWFGEVIPTGLLYAKFYGNFLNFRCPKIFSLGTPKFLDVTYKAPPFGEVSRRSAEGARRFRPIAPKIVLEGFPILGPTLSQVHTLSIVCRRQLGDIAPQSAR